MGTTKVKSHLPNHQAGIKYCRVFLVRFSAVYWASLCNASMHCWCVTSCCYVASQHTRNSWNRLSHLAIAIRQFAGLTVAGWHILFFHRDWRAFIVCRPWDMTIAVAMLYVSLSIINPRLCPSNIIRPPASAGQLRASLLHFIHVKSLSSYFRRNTYTALTRTSNFALYPPFKKWWFYGIGL